jgi:DNA adenine methylase
MRPPTAYYGGKTRLANDIVQLLPKHRCYTEPFAGALAVLLAKSPATHEVVNDIDGDIVNFWQVLRDHPDELQRLCLLTPYARAEYELVDRDTVCNLEPLERARQWWVRINQSHGRTNTNAGWSTGFARSGSRARETINSALRMPAVAERLRAVSIENRDAVEVLRTYDGPDTLHYVDPPYPAQARNSVGYRHEMPSDDDHRALAEVLRSCEGTVVLSGYACPLYDELYGDWWRTTFHAVKSNGGRVGADGAAVEVLWSNQPLNFPSQLHLTADLR